MVDRGFLIRDFLFYCRVKFIIFLFIRKCFWGKGKYLFVFEILKIRNIVKFCIYVERVIGRLKIFYMLFNIMLINLKFFVD